MGATYTLSFNGKDTHLTRTHHLVKGPPNRWITAIGQLITQMASHDHWFQQWDEREEGMSDRHDRQLTYVLRTFYKRHV